MLACAFIICAIGMFFALTQGCSKKVVKADAEPSVVNTNTDVAEPDRPEPVQPAITEQAQFENINFDFDEYFIREDAKRGLIALSVYLRETGKSVLIEGHCDERGGYEYNMVLGDRRAWAAKDYLVRLGVRPEKIETISYGKEKKICFGITEDCHAVNRRCEFKID